MSIKENVQQILSSIPENVFLEAAAKTRTKDDIIAAIDAGVKIIGENYLQESIDIISEIGDRAEWHYIGHLQRGKIKRIVEYFNMIETVDSFSIAKSIDKNAKKNGKVMPILIEVNSGREEQKAGLLPENLMDFVKEAAKFENLRVMGLMTMGPYYYDPSLSRPYFSLTKDLFEKIKEVQIQNVEMRYLSMGMSSSYKVAIEEGANIIRVGEAIFGPR